MNKARLLLFALASLLLCAQLPGAAAQATETAACTFGECAICRAPARAVVNSNDIGGFPRFNMLVQPVSTDLANYLFHCVNGTPDNCHEVSVLTAQDNAAFAQGQLNPAAPESGTLVDYIQGLMMPMVLSIFFAFAFLVLSILFCICRCCCNTCGKRYPTVRLYSPGQRKLAKVHMLITFLLVVAFILMGELNGTQKLGPAFAAVINSPVGFVALVPAIVTPVRVALTGVLGTLVVPMVGTIGTELGTALRVPEMQDNISCLLELVDSPPGIAEFGGILDELDGILDSLPTFNESFASINEMNTFTNSLGPVVARTRMRMVSMDTAITRLSNLTDLQSLLGRLNTTINKLKPFPPSLKQQLQQMEDAMPDSTFISNLNTNLNNLPTSGCQNAADDTYFNAACTSGSIAAAATFRATVKTQLNALKSTVAGAPNLVALADELVSFNDTINSIDYIDDLVAELQGVQTRVDALPPLDAIEDDMVRLETLIDNFDLSNITSLLIRLNSTVRADRFNGVLDLVQPATDSVKSRVDRSLNCLGGLVGVLRRVNASLIRLPSFADEIADTVDDARSTVGDQVNEFTNFTIVDDLRSSIDDIPDMSEYINQTLSVQDDIDELLAQLNFTSVIADLSNLNSTAAENRDFGNITSSTADTSATLNDPDTRPKAADVDKLRSMQADVDNVGPSVDSILAAIAAWENGVCVGGANAGTACLGSNSGTVCGAGAVTCTAARWPGVCANDPTVDCTADAACSGVGGACLPNLAPGRSSMQGSVDSLNDRPNLNDLTSQLTNLENNINDTPDPAESINQIDNLKSSLDDVPDLLVYVNDLDTLNATLEASPDTEELLRTFEDFGDTLDELDLSDMRNEMNTLNETVKEQVPRDEIDQVTDFLDMANDLLYDNLNTFTASLSNPTLRDYSDENGLGKTLLYIMENVINYVRPLNDSTTEGIQETNDTQVGPIVETLRVADDTSLLHKKGPWFYLLRILENVPDSPVAGMGFVAVDGGEDGNVLSSSELQAYPLPEGTPDMPLPECCARNQRYLDNGGSDPNSGNGGNGPEEFGEGDGGFDPFCECTPRKPQAICVTSACINNTVARGWVEPLNSDVFYPSGSDATPVAAPVAPSFALLVPAAIPLLVVLIGLCGCICNRGCPAWTMLICLVPLTVFILIFSSMFLTFWLAFGDVCSSMESVGRKAVLLYANTDITISQDLPGGFLPGNDVADTNINASVNALGAYEDVMSECSADGEFSAFFAAFRDPMGTYARDVLTTTVSSEFADGISLRASLRSDLQSTIDDTPGVVTDIVDAVEDALGCESVQDAFIYVKDSICCGVLGSFYYMTVAWWMIGWTLMCCGCCAGVRGYKRFPTKTWGPKSQQVDAMVPVGSDLEAAPTVVTTQHYEPGVEMRTTKEW